MSILETYYEIINGFKVKMIRVNPEYWGNRKNIKTQLV